MLLLVAAFVVVLGGAVSGGWPWNIVIAVSTILAAGWIFLLAWLRDSDIESRHPRSGTSQYVTAEMFCGALLALFADSIDRWEVDVRRHGGTWDCPRYVATFTSTSTRNTHPNSEATLERHPNGSWTAYVKYSRKYAQMDGTGRDSSTTWNKALHKAFTQARGNAGGE